MNFCPACGAQLARDAPVRCAKCGRSHWRNPKPCAGALVVDAQRLLFVRRAHDPWCGLWDIPGGFCAIGEHPIETAVREVREETGLAIAITGFLGIWLDEYEQATAGEPPETTLNLYYHAVPLGGVAVVADPAEVAEVGWFPRDGLPAVLAFPAHSRDVLNAWLEAERDGRTATPLPDRPAR